MNHSNLGMNQKKVRDDFYLQMNQNQMSQNQMKRKNGRSQSMAIRNPNQNQFMFNFNPNQNQIKVNHLTQGQSDPNQGQAGGQSPNSNSPHSNVG